MQKDILITSPTPQKTKYGTYTPKLFYVADSGYRFRIDEYKSDITGDVTRDSIMVVNQFDLSHVVTERKFGKNCHCCFAGYAHSENQCKNS